VGKNVSKQTFKVVILRFCSVVEKKGSAMNIALIHPSADNWILLSKCVVNNLRTVVLFAMKYMTKVVYTSLSS
jgi:hypothetical protein